ncbi:probable histone-lysine N-methyltransferase CG1716 isoform X2 [Phymastichus coffea]|nr:probable histone-lysine N-methyltransferase CG1716 isoform X2 [Phymastichus coffea]
MEIETESTVESSVIPNKNTSNQVSFINDTQLKEKNTFEFSANKITKDSRMVTSEHFEKSLLLNSECTNSNSYQMVEEGLSGLHVTEIHDSIKSPVLTIVEVNCRTSHAPFNNFNGNLEISSQVDNKKIVKNAKAKKFVSALMKSNNKKENEGNSIDQSFDTEIKEKIMKSSSKQAEQSLLLSHELETKNKSNIKHNGTLIINEISLEKDDGKFLSTLTNKRLIKEHSTDSEINSKMDFEDSKLSSSSESSTDTLLPKTCGLSDLNIKGESDKQCEINDEKTEIRNKNEDTIKSDSGSNHSGVRRSNRIKHIGLQKQKSCGRGLVIKPIQESQKVSISDSLINNAVVMPEQHHGSEITKRMKNLIQTQLDKSNYKCPTIDNFPSVIHCDSNTNKPVKVKSRWRRSSELEMSNNTSWSASQQSSNISSAGNDVSVEDSFSNSTAIKELNCNIDPLRLPSALLKQESDQTTISTEDSVTCKIITFTLVNNLSQNVSIIPNNIGAKPLPMIPEVDREMEERLRQFEHLRENLYLTERYTNKETKRMVCDCFLTEEEIQRGELGCGEDCLNRLLMIECGSRCIVGDRCTNRRFQNCNYAKCEVFRTEKKGFGLRAITDLNAGEFIMEYVGEVVDSRGFRKRAKEYSKDKNRHYYFMALKSDQIIDATMKGNISRFINHSCDPNAETQKWTVNGELRIGFFNKKFVAAGEEITFDYHFQRYGKEAQKCFCEATNCRGWIGDNPEDSKTNAECRKHDKEDDEDDEDDDDDDDDDEDGEDNDEDDNDSNKESGLKEKKKEDKKEKAERQTKRNKREDKKIIDHMEDEDLEEQIDRLCASGLKNRAHTLTLSRLMVRCRELQHRRRLLEVIRSGEQPCRRLFLDYHGLRLMWSYMMDVAGSDSEEAQQFRSEIVRTLATLPIPNRTMLIDSKVLSVVEKWSKQLCHSPSVDSPNEEVEMKEAAGDKDSSVETTMVVAEQWSLLSELAGNLLESWSNLKEVFRIPKKERLEQMKEHEREADRGYKEDAEREARETLSYERHRAERHRGGGESDKRPERRRGPESLDLVQVPRMSKFERRQLFALKVAQEEEERQRRQQEELWQQHQAQCLALGLDPQATAALDPQSGYPLLLESQLVQWSSFAGAAEQQSRQPGLAQRQSALDGPEALVPAVADLEQPPPALDLPPKWRWARDKRGRVYYYHARERVSQWLPPPPDHIGLQPDSGPDSSSDESSDASSSSRDNDENDEEETAGCAPTVDERDEPDDEDGLVDELLVDEQPQLRQPDSMDLDAPQPPRTDARRRRDGLVQERIISPRRDEDRIDYSKFKELKDKLRRQKDKSRLKEQSDKLRKHRRSLKSKSHAKQSGLAKSFQSVTSDMSPTSERKIKDTFRINMAHVMVHFLNPYRKNDCKQGRITNTEDFKYLARKLTHFVLAKELKHCKSVDELECNDNVKHKAKDFVRKYMNKFGAAYQRDKDED